MKPLAFILCRYARTVALADFTVDLMEELDLRAHCAAGGARSPNQRPPREVLEWLAWICGLVAFLWICIHSRY